MQIQPTLSSYTALNPCSLLRSIDATIQKTWNTFKEKIGEFIRDVFFMPLFGKLSTELQKDLQREVQFVQDFWDVHKPANPHLPYHNEILKKFSCKKESLSIMLHGKNLQVECSIIEARTPSTKPTQNLVCVLGNLCTNDNNITTQYPFLASYLEKAKQDPAIDPLRVISISQYNTSKNGHTYKVKNLDESGEILTQVLKQITKEKGPITQVTAHSLGTIILGAALKYATLEKDVLPLNIYFDRGPSCIQKASLRFGLTGWVAWQLAKLSGWDINVGHEVQKHLSNRPKQNVVISEAIQDHHFSLGSLCQSPLIQNLTSEQGIQRLSFDFAAQLYNDPAHHNIHNGLLDGHHLVPRKASVLQNNETMSDKIMKVFDKSSYRSWTSFFQLPTFST